MTDVLFADQPTLEGERVRLRPFRADDADTMLEILDDPEVQIFTGSVHSRTPQPREPGHAERVRGWYATRSAQRDRLDLALVDRGADEVVGEVVINEWSPEDQSANYRVLIGPRGRNRGLGSEATRLVVDHAFAVTDLHRIELEVYAFNRRAQRVYEKAGFTVEGIRREAFRLDDERVDALVMAVLRPEWEAGRAD